MRCNLNYSAAANQENCSLFDESAKISTHVDYHLPNIFGYGGTHWCILGSHSNQIQNGGHAYDDYIIYQYFQQLFGNKFT